MIKLKKLLYLLQLEEYNTERYIDWLKKHNIQNLKENKGKLKFTLRIKLMLFLGLVLSLFFKKNKAIALINNLIEKPFTLIKTFLIFLAKQKLKKHNLIKIIITGSYGKTTFKEMLASVLKTKYKILKTPENINTEIGIAKLILKKLNTKHEIFIIEAGAYKAGEIKNICEFVRPDYGIVTIIGYMHLERFKTLKNIKKTKLELVPYIKNKKHLFIPQQNHKFINFNKTIKTIARQLKISNKKTQITLKLFKAPKHRLQTKKINKQVTILDNTYNSNPLGFKKSLKKLSKYKKHQKIIITPGMIELGHKQFELNKNLAKLTGEISDIFIIIGKTNQKALLAGATQTMPRKNIILLSPTVNIDQKVSSLLKPPTIILLENELPDHYF